MILTLLLLVGLNAYSADFSNLTATYIYDGDTLFVDLPGAHPLIGKRLGIRLRGINTPEIGQPGSIVSRDFVRSELKNMIFDLTECSRGKYFRLVCKVIYNGRDLSVELLKRNLAREYNP